MLRLKKVIARLEKQQRELKKSIALLRQIERSGVLKGIRQTQSLDEVEKQLVAEALERSDGNQTQAAKILLVSRDKLRYKMAKHHLKR